MKLAYKRAAWKKRARAINIKDKLMKSIRQNHAKHDLIEVLSESVMATLIIGLSLAATLVAVMLVIGV